MVRQIVGVLAEVGRGKLSLKELKNLLNVASATPAKLTAPPSGLFLERVYYEGEEELDCLEAVMKIESEKKR
jgi:tRNA pseudouridine38-40 synthase